MGCILASKVTELFISYAPGTGSSALEQHLRTKEQELASAGFVIEHFPSEPFGIGSTISRHVTYDQFHLLTKRSTDAVATGVRNPFDYYYAEYRRCHTKWALLLSDRESWLYSPASASTLRLVKLAEEAKGFNEWLHTILEEHSIANQYLWINEDHCSHATLFLKAEDMDESLSRIFIDVFGVDIPAAIGPIPRVNEGAPWPLHEPLAQGTLGLAQSLFGPYMSKFGYSYEDSNYFRLSLGHQ